ncbi:MAG: vitamin B12-dependent ribonucleotide reductase [Acidobacteria bacterium]|nr:vitamin B12-dependent ribonucleotide reductase [Acidobacteriota bacterium]MDA1234424.1 vitamin B12-dependent ribonucleotide reductase [Acidobacteriota bacterium]
MGEIRVDLSTVQAVPEFTTQPSRRGLAFSRHFTRDIEAGKTPYDLIDWEKRSSSITSVKGEIVFEQHDIEAPRGWSQTATNIVASKYFHGTVGESDRESSVGQLVHRVVDTIANWGRDKGYFATVEDAENFRFELAHLMLHQMASFNSPVWFNVGVKDTRGYGWSWDAEAGKVNAIRPDVHTPQCSACFINSVDDSLSSIMDLAKTEGMLFKWGSGAGSNLSKIREDDASLAGGGRASGPVSFMKGFDAFAGVIKSGGKTRRAAKMVILNADHPDIEQFINCKAAEERKAWALIDAGFDSSIDGAAYSSIAFQNANHSVRATDEFMEAAAKDGDWWTRSVLTGQPKDRKKARKLLREIADATHQCGDPGMQFDTAVNRWHTCKATDRINASNPCSEYMFLDDSACNLSSLNLMKFRKRDGKFNVEGFRHAVDTLIVAQEILVDSASYPTERIARNSHDFRPLGLGFANLGALLMSQGVAYDSDKGRDTAGAISALMCGQAYLTSARISGDHGGPFPGYAPNRDSFLGVIAMHRDAAERLTRAYDDTELRDSAEQVWKDAYAVGEKYGYRNAQTTVIAPTGTIGFMMDCDTTGIEPELALVKYKKLVGGGLIKIVNNTVPEALTKLGYKDNQVSEIVDHVDSTGTIEGAPHLKDEHLTVFDTSFQPQNGTRSIHYRGHIHMMAAVQPFVSGAISKTINMPEECTAEDIVEAYIESWELGLKAVAIYRDGSKKAQPLSTGDKKVVEKVKVVREPYRRRLSDERASVTHKFSVGGHEGYITVGLFKDGAPGEVFIKMSKEGSTISGLMDSFATAVSLSLQYGVPLKDLVEKFQHVRYEPSGWTNNQEIRYAKSLTDYIFRWLGGRFVSPEYKATEAGETPNMRPTEKEPQQALEFEAANTQDAPFCAECGSMMVVNGSCYKCENCGSTSGCS